MIVHETLGFIYPVRLIQEKFDSYTVEAHTGKYCNLTYTEAGKKYGEAILYALAWERKLKGPDYVESSEEIMAKAVHA